MNNFKTIFVAVCTVMVGGCASYATESDSQVVGGETGSVVELQAAQRRVAELESELSARDRSMRSAEAQRMSTEGSSTSSNLFPPNPKVGECYARVMIPAKYRTVTEQVVKSDASERFEIIPARYETVEERVLVNEASTRLEVVPAEYQGIEERVLVKAASTKIIEIPAEYATVTEQVLDKAAHTVWKKGPATFQTANVLSEATSDTGEIMCLVEVPATYKTVTKRVLRRPASTEVVEIPAEYKMVSKRVVKTPATTREIKVPAEYDTIQVTKLVAPASEKRVAIPAEFGAVSRTEKVSDANVEWRQVVCEVNLTRPNVIELQKALADKGYYKVGVDGIIGPRTLNAAQKYAADNNLPSGSNYIPVEVVESLNLDI